MNSVLISVNNSFPIDLSEVKKAVKEILRSKDLLTEVEVSLVFVGEDKMRMLNSRHLSKDEVVSVLSFSQLEGGGKQINKSPELKLPLGDIVICYPEAEKLAKKVGVSIDKQLNQLIKHGLENLLRFYPMKRL